MKNYCMAKLPKICDGDYLKKNYGSPLLHQSFSERTDSTTQSWNTLVNIYEDINYYVPINKMKHKHMSKFQFHKFFYIFLICYKFLYN